MVRVNVLVTFFLVFVIILPLGTSAYALDIFEPFTVIEPQVDYYGDTHYGSSFIDIDRIVYWSTEYMFYLRIHHGPAPSIGVHSYWAEYHCTPNRYFCQGHSLRVTFYDEHGQPVYLATLLSKSANRYILLEDIETGGVSEAHGDWVTTSRNVEVGIDISALPKLGETFYLSVESERYGVGGVYNYRAMDKIPNSGLLPAPPFDFSLTIETPHQTVAAGEEASFQIWIDDPLASLLKREVSLEVIGLNNLPFLLNNTGGTPPFSSTLTVLPPASSGGNYTFRIRGTMADDFYTVNKTIILQLSVVPLEVIRQKEDILSSLNDEIEKAKRVLESLQAEISSLEERRMGVINSLPEVKELRDKLSITQSELSSLQEQLETVKATLEKTQLELKETLAKPADVTTITQTREVTKTTTFVERDATPSGMEIFFYVVIIALLLVIAGLAAVYRSSRRT